jgi:carboxypeptidase Q
LAPIRETIPTIDILLEDYGMLYALLKTATIRSSCTCRIYRSRYGSHLQHHRRNSRTEKPDEYIILSAHYDSWDAGTGATDNGTGSITMMEVARILKEVYPNPKRTILVGLVGK